MDKLTVVKREFPFKRGSNYYITYKGEQLALPSVTTILGETLPKKMLTQWAAKTAATFALANPGCSVEEAVSSMYGTRDKAGARGKAIHAWAEAHARGEELKLDDLTEDLQTYGKGFQQFMEDEKPIPHTIKGQKLIEFIVFNPEVGYAGTCDFASKDYIYDWKTSKNIFIDHHLQQVAYLNATHILLPDKTIVPMHKFKGAYLVHLTPKGTGYKVPVEAEFEDFITTLKMYNMLKKYHE